jgi:type VI secretion system protein ImpC
VDGDTLHDALGRLGVRLDLPMHEPEASRLALRFDGLEDFHPDQLFTRLELFRGLRETRERLNDPKTFPAAAALVRAWAASEGPGEGPQDQGGEAAGGTGEGGAGSEAIVRELLEASRRRAREAGPPGGEDWAQFLKQIVQPHLVPGEDPQRAELVARVDRAAESLMRAILHHPDFQALEAGWRALEFLLRRLEMNTELRVYVLDVSKAELAADLRAPTNLESTGLLKLLVEGTVGTPGGMPWAVVGGNYVFDGSLEDVALLARLAKIAQAAGAPFLAAASPLLVGCPALAESPDPTDWQRDGGKGAHLWNALRELPEAAYLGLALPRFLLRLPYGKASAPLEHFEFEELAGGPRHEAYLWGNPAFACICLLGQAFSEHGWTLHPGSLQEIEGLPFHVYQEDGEPRMKPCAEAWLTVRAAEAILEEGLMPLLSIRDRDAVRLARFQSLRKPLTPLAGRWGG